ncbi:response regulator transcription factor [Virgisporangium ochraceum]
MRILLVEDDDRFAGVLTGVLRRLGHDVTHAATVASALAAPEVDLVLLDLGLPDGDGVALCRRFRERGAVGIVVLTARDGEPDRAAALRAGADDYLVKPVDVATLRARLDAVARRPSRPPVVGAVRVDPHTREAFVDGVPVGLTGTEFQLLALLLAEPGAVVTRERLLAEVWPTGRRVRFRTLDTHVAALRAQLGDRVALDTVRGVGYRLG